MSNNRYSHRVLLLLAVLIIIARGFYDPLYEYGLSNHTNLLPLIMHTVDPTYLSADWVTMVRTGVGSPRFIFISSVAAVAKMFGIPATVFVIYVLSTAVGICALYLLLNHLFEDRLVAILTIGTVLSPVVAIIDLGGNSLFQSYLIPSHLANTLILVGFTFVIRRQYRRGFAIFGIATLFHLSNGFWMSVVAGIYVMLFEFFESIQDLDLSKAIQRVPWTAAGIYGIIVLGGLAPLLQENLTSSTDFYPVYLMAWVRHPHHWVPSTWVLWQLAATVFFTAGTTVLLYYFRKNVFASKQSAIFAFTWIGSLSAIFVAGGIFTEVYPIPTLIKSQMFHVDDFLFVLLFGGLWKLGLYLFRRISGGILDSPSEFLSRVTVVFLVIVLITTPILGAQFEIYKTSDQSSSLSESYDWISEETPEDAVLIANPGLAGFRLETGRAMVVNIKSFPFRPTAMIEWGERIKSVCGIQQQLTNSRLFECKSSYPTLDEEIIRRTAIKYDSCWVLSRNQTYSFDRKFSNDEYTVYHLQNSTHC
jgi:hypothetical protein